ncbi:transposase family protein [Streptomyces cyaneofuscatus]|uniref:transposase family protein n=1 Tax=Streptomyces cyaneofuscatus TaxID=66883 RepID=UPI0036D82214
MLVCPSSIDLSTRTLRFLAGQLTARRRDIGTRWRRLPVARQALLALAHLRCGDTYARLASNAGRTRHTKAYQGAGRPVRVPYRGRHLKQRKRRHNTTHAKTRCLREQAMVTLKGWHLLRKLRCGTNRVTAIVQAVPVLHHASA